MILQRLYELAKREKLLDDPAFVLGPLSCSIEIDCEGRFLGVIDLRKLIEMAGGGRRKPSKKYVCTLELPVPVRPVVWDTKARRWKSTDPAASGTEKPAVFLADTLPRVLPCDATILGKYKAETIAGTLSKDVAKYTAQRSTFWRFAGYVAEQIGDDALTPLTNFCHRTLNDPDLVAAIWKQLRDCGLALGDMCTFAIREDGGRTVLDAPARQSALNWWREFYDRDATSRGAGKVRLLCQVTREMTVIDATVKTKIEGLTPIGCRAEAYLVTGLDSAESYGFKGASSRMVSAKGVEGFTRSLNALIANKLVYDDGSPAATSRRIGRTIFLYWTKNNRDTRFFSLLDDPASDPIKVLVESVHGGADAASTLDTEPFYVLALSGNSARAIVRGYLETTLPKARQNIVQWFADLRIADTSKNYAGASNAMYSLKTLAGATIPRKGLGPDWKKLPDHVSEQLLNSALRNTPVPDSILVACLRRLHAEGRKAFRASRMALLKLILIRKVRAMADQQQRETTFSTSEQLNAEERDSAYVYGRMLSILEQIQSAALQSVNANVTDKFYGTMSSAPGMIVGRLLANAQNHLKKLRTDGNERKKRQAEFFDRHLTQLHSLLGATPPKFRHSVQEQARFALGFYHEKAKRLERIALAKAKREQKASRN